MPTNRSITSSISIHAKPEQVFDLVSDPLEFPTWAPGFARSVRSDGEHWTVDTGAGEARVAVRVSRERGTVDIVSPDQPTRGVFTRVLANGDGCEYLFTQFFPDAVSAEDVVRQVEVVEGELATIKRLVEG
jgi:carbon monoxide dehydrogenase subunit G